MLSSGGQRQKQVHLWMTIIIIDRGKFREGSKCGIVIPSEANDSLLGKESVNINYLS